MSFANSYEDAPTFADETELSVTAVNILRQNAILLDALSLRGMRAFQSAGLPSKLNHWPRVNPLRIWWGSFQYRTGLTTATFAFTFASIAAGTLKIYLNGTLRDSVALANGNMTRTITISGLGFTDQQVVEVEVQIAFSVAPTSEGGSYLCTDAYVSPYSAVATGLYGAWPGVPTFGSLSAANLNQLSNASDWLMHRLSVIPLPLFQSYIAVQSRSSPQTYPLWWGSVARVNGNDKLSISVGYISHNQSEVLKLYVNGVLAATSPTLTGNGSSGIFTLEYDMSALTANTMYPIRIDNVITTGNPSSYQQPRMSRWSIRDIRAVPLSAYAYATPPAESATLESLTFSALQSRLNAIATMLSAIKTRIDACPQLFDYARMYRRRYVFSDAFDTGWTDFQVPSTARAGTLLVVRGKAVQIGYGPITVKSMPDKAAIEYENATETELIAGERVDSQTVSLDSFDGLYAGMPYMLRGTDVRYAAEILR